MGRGEGNKTYIIIVAVRKRTAEGPNDVCIFSCPSKGSPPFRRRTLPEPPEGSLCLPVKYKAMPAVVWLLVGLPILEGF